MEKDNIISLWRNKPIASPGATPEDLVFASGRQAVTAAIASGGLSRPHRMAIPEWSSACVINCVGQLCSPVPMSEAVEYPIELSALLLYEQWGWPLPRETMERIHEMKLRLLILDRVDSPDIERGYESSLAPVVCEAFSLSKTLGGPGGGLLRRGGNLEAAPETVSTDSNTLACIEQIEDDTLREHILKTFISTKPTNLKAWLAENDIFSAFADEAHLRRKNIDTLRKSRLWNSFPRWMNDAVDDGAAPGIIPLMSEMQDADMLEAQGILFGTFKIESSLYHFNFNGDPFSPSYKRCLAVPIHGQVTDIFNEVLHTMDKIIKK